MGYVMGLGDRHPQNILFDPISAELVHIDFGVAFEQVIAPDELFFSGIDTYFI